MVSKIVTLACLIAGSACTAPAPTPKVVPGLYDRFLTNVPESSNLATVYPYPVYLAENGEFTELGKSSGGRWRNEGGELIYMVSKFFGHSIDIPEFELKTLRPDRVYKGIVFKINSPTEFTTVFTQKGLEGTLTFRRRADIPTDDLMKLDAAAFERARAGQAADEEDYREEMGSTILFAEAVRRRADLWRIASDPKKPPTERFLAAGLCGSMSTDAEDAAYAAYLRAFDFASLEDEAFRRPVRRNLASYRNVGFMSKSLAVIAEWVEQGLLEEYHLAKNLEYRPTAQFNTTLLKLLARPKGSSKGQLCLALGKSGDESVRPALQDATKLTKPQDQIGALCGLIHLGLPEGELVRVVDQLLAVAPKHQYSDLMVIPTLGKANVPAARKALVRWAQGDNEADVYSALRALRELNAPEYLPLLDKLAADEEAVGRSAARQHLWELRGRK